MDSRFAAWLLAALAYLAVVPARAVVLVTDDEVRAEVQANLPEPLVARAGPSPGSPRIQVLQPALSGSTLKNPLLIELRFNAESDAEIVPSSFRVFYGILRLDVTERILKAVQVLKTGLTVDNAQIPAGSHRLFLRIVDSKERAVETELRFSID